MTIRGVRGATTVSQDDPGEILQAVHELLESMLLANPGLHSEDIASALFTTTDDLSSVYPAQAARAMGWTHVPLMCMRELPVPGGLALCIRVLLHWNTDLRQQAVHHVYLKGAARLRPDLKM